MKLKRAFYERDTVAVARDLLGCLLISNIENEQTSGMIVETEAYLGEKDPGSHAYKGKTGRCRVMYERAGKAYIYLIYGKHHLLNVVTERAGIPGAVLIRALEPVEGIETMQQRRSVTALRSLTSGPGKLTQALSITTVYNGCDLTEDTLYLKFYRAPKTVNSSSRIGVSDRQHLRFFIKGNDFVSRKK